MMQQLKLQIPSKELWYPYSFRKTVQRGCAPPYKKHIPFKINSNKGGMLKLYPEKRKQPKQPFTERNFYYEEVFPNHSCHPFHSERANGVCRAKSFARAKQRICHALNNSATKGHFKPSQFLKCFCCLCKADCIQNQGLFPAKCS